MLDLLQNGEQFDWDPEQPDDRVVIFTERIRTMNYLAKQLAKDLDLSEEAITVLHGSMSDVEQQEVVEGFGNAKSPLRLLVASDVASEGINLHYQSHRLIHFDIPWSLMIFQQRNGRIDRYGQQHTPQIYYFLQHSGTPNIKADERILELLIQKDEFAQKNIGDNSVFMNEYDSEAEERKTARAIEQDMSDEAFEDQYLKEDVDLLSQLMGGEEASELTEYESADDYKGRMPSLYANDFEYVKDALKILPDPFTKQVDIDEEERIINWTIPKKPSDLRDRYEYLPVEIKPNDWRINLTDRKERVQEEIERSRESEEDWPVVDYLWQMHPVVDWLTEKSLNAFGRKEAPIIEATDRLEPGAEVIVCSGSYPNRRGQPVLHKWCAAYFKPGAATPEIWTFEEMVERLELKQTKIPNRNQPIDDKKSIREKLPVALEKVKDWLDDQREMFEDITNKKLNARLQELDEYRGRQLHQLEIKFTDERQMEKEQRRYNNMMDDYIEWIEDTMLIEKSPHIQIAAAFVGKRR